VLEWALRLALECRRRVKEQQKRIGSAEFRNTQFSYSMGEDGVEKFVATPELYSENSISSDPLPPGRSGSFRRRRRREPRPVSSGHYGRPRQRREDPEPAAPAPPFKNLYESVRCAEQNLYTRAKELVLAKGLCAYLGIRRTNG
jgi:ATP-dependent Lon protease